MGKGPFFHKSKVKECYFTNTTLIKSDFAYADLQGTVFHNCNLSKSNFMGAICYAIDPLVNDIKKARFSYPEVTSLLDYFDIIIDENMV